MIALYAPGSSPLHRMPAGPKLVLLMVAALTISLFATRLLALVVCLALVLTLFLVAGVGLRRFVQQVLAIRWVILVMLVSQLIFLSTLAAMTNTGRVVIVITLASLVSLTTRTSDLLAATTRAMGPLRRIKIDPEAIGLLLAMTITTIPVIAGLALSIREAQRARGAPIRLATFAVPLLVMSLKHADELSDALAARTSSPTPGANPETHSRTALESVGLTYNAALDES